MTEALEASKKILFRRKANIIGLVAAIAFSVVIFYMAGSVINYEGNDILPLMFFCLWIVIIFIVFSIVEFKTNLLLQNLLLVYGRPRLYYEVYQLTKRKGKQYRLSNLMLEITANFYLGNFEYVISNIRDTSILFQPRQVEFVSYYIQSQFFVENREGVNEGKSLMENAKSKPYYKNPNIRIAVDSCISIADFALSFLSGDYSLAHRLCDQFQKHDNIPIINIYFDYYTAICEYAIGNYDIADQLFQAIAEKDESLILAKLAKAYVNR